MINSLADLENLIKILKANDIPSFKLDGLEITLNKTNTSVLKEEVAKKPLNVFEDPDFYSGIPMHTKMREND